MSGLLDSRGNPVASDDFVVCPRCGEGAKARRVMTFFGGWWSRVCDCGYVYEKGQGVPPLEE